MTATKRRVTKAERRVWARALRLVESYKVPDGVSGVPRDIEGRQRARQRFIAEARRVLGRGTNSKDGHP